MPSQLVDVVSDLPINLVEVTDRLKDLSETAASTALKAGRELSGTAASTAFKAGRELTETAASTAKRAGRELTGTAASTAKRAGRMKLLGIPALVAVLGLGAFLMVRSRRSTTDVGSTSSTDAFART